MQPRTIIIIVIVLVILAVLPLVLFSTALLSIGNRNTGETIPQTDVVAGNTDAGPITSAVPPVLANLFKEAGSRVGVPAALLAAISFQECNRLWQAATRTPDLIQDWITNNTDVDSRGCGFDNGYRVWGPMQFQDTTFGLNKHANPRSHPAPKPGSWGDQAGRLTGHRPASMLSIRDSIYAAALKIFSDAGKPKSWGEPEVRKAAKRYFGACYDTIGGKPVYYCDDIVRRWRQYSGTLGN